MPRSGVRIAATTRHPSRYRRTADAKPSPRDAPVIRTVLVSAIRVVRRTTHALRTELDVGPAVRQVVLPGGPLTDRVRAFGAVLLVVALRIEHLRLGIRPRAGDRGGQPTGLDR